MTIEEEITPQPAHVGTITVNLHIADSAKRPVDGAQVALEADMSHPGMSPVFADARELGSGVYQAQLPLGMAGDWIILLHIVLADGQRVERQINVDHVRPNQAGC